MSTRDRVESWWLPPTPTRGVLRFLATRRVIGNPTECVNGKTRVPSLAASADAGKGAADNFIRQCVWNQSECSGAATVSAVRFSLIPPASPDGLGEFSQCIVVTFVVYRARTLGCTGLYGFWICPPSCQVDFPARSISAEPGKRRSFAPYRWPASCRPRLRQPLPGVRSPEGQPGVCHHLPTDY